ASAHVAPRFTSWRISRAAAPRAMWTRREVILVALPASSRRRRRMLKGGARLHRGLQLDRDVATVDEPVEGYLELTGQPQEHVEAVDVPPALAERNVGLGFELRLARELAGREAPLLACVSESLRQR